MNARCEEDPESLNVKTSGKCSYHSSLKGYQRQGNDLNHWCNTRLN